MHSQGWRTFRVQTSPIPMLSRMPSPRQRIPGITLGIGFLRLRSGQALGDPSRQGIRPGRLLPLLREPLTGYSVPVQPAGLPSIFP